MGKDDKLDRLIGSVNAVIRANAGARVNGKIASNRTQEYSQQVMGESCRRLHRLGFYLENINGLGEKHIQALVKDWHRQKLSNKTMQNQYSRLKIFCGWLGKPGIVDNTGVGVSAYLPEVDATELKVRTYTETSKSWSGNGIDVTKKIEEALLQDERYGNMLRLILAFGLRKKEVLRIKLWSADKGKSLDIEGPVAKNGKFRSIQIDDSTEYGKFQRWCLDQAKKLCGKYKEFGWPGLQYKQSENRYYHFMKRIGATKADIGVVGHGLRAEFFENQAMLRGMLPPVLGGSNQQLSRGEIKRVNTEVSQLGGHDDTHAISSYYGSLRKYPKTNDIGERAASVVMDSTNELIASIYLYPPVILGPDGGYRSQSEAERSDVMVSVVKEKLGLKPVRQTIHEFLELHPEMSARMKDVLVRVGL